MRAIDIEAEENVIKFYRKHPLKVARKLLWAALAVAVGIFLIKLNIRYISFVGVVLLVVALGKFLYEFIIWYYDIYVLTNRRIIDIEQRGIFSRNVVDAPLGNIVNISQSTKGVLETVFNFGTVSIQTAGSELKFEGVSNPAEVQGLIRQTLDEHKGKE